MRQLTVYLRCFFKYLKHGDIRSIIISVQYLLFNTRLKNDRIFHTSTGTFFFCNNNNNLQFVKQAYEWSLESFIHKQIEGFSVFIDGGLKVCWEQAYKRINL